MTRFPLLGVLAVCAWMAAAPAGWAESRGRAAKDESASSQPATSPANANYEALRRVQATAKRNEEINRIATDFRAKRIDAATAKRQLEPLLKEQAREQAAAADQQIAMLKDQIADMELLKRNTSEWVQGRMKQLLGLDKPAEQGSKPPKAK